MVQGDRSDGRILPAFETWEVFQKVKKSQVLPLMSLDLGWSQSISIWVVSL